MDFLRKLQNLPERTKKTILWTVVVIVGIGLFIWWIKITAQRIKNFQKEEFFEELKLPALGGELKGVPKVEIPKIEMPEISEEELRELEEAMKEAEQEK